MTVQDNERERELVRLFNLDWNATHQRSGVDAILDIEVDGSNFRFEVEVKSTTGNTVSTARDVGMEHIEKWRTKLFVIGFYSRLAGRPELQNCLCLTPLDMEPWISSIEQKILIDFQIAQLTSERLALADLFAVCGEADNYAVADARRLHKQQWSSEQYAAAQDIIVNGVPRISQTRMLEIFRLRAKYIADRGATLNNPHISSRHLEPFFGTDREMPNNWASQVRTIARTFTRENPEHRAIITL